MATIRKRGDLQWEAQIRKKGWAPVSKTFDYKKDAEAWARAVEREMDTGHFIPRTEAQNTTLAEALNRYASEVTPLKKGAQRELMRIKAWQARPIARRALAGIRPQDIAQHRDARRAEGRAENTIRLELALLSQVFKTAALEWGINITNPVALVKKPGGSRSRMRRLLADEERYLWESLQELAPTMPYIVPACKFAIETGMRQSELLGLDWEDLELDLRVAHLVDTKNSDPRDVPLSSTAIKILRGLPKPHKGRVFAVSQDYLTRTLQRAVVKARKQYEKDCIEKSIEPAKRMLVDLHFHDFRHEAASRLASKLAAQELAKMMGWRTLQMAMRYYHPRAEELALKLN